MRLVEYLAVSKSGRPPGVFCRPSFPLLLSCVPVGSCEFSLPFGSFHGKDVPFGCGFGGSMRPDWSGGFSSLDPECGGSFGPDTVSPRFIWD